MPAPAEITGHVATLASISRAQAAKNFLDSPEFRSGPGPRQTAFLIYAGLLLRDPVPSERAFMADYLQNKGLLKAIEYVVGSSDMSGLLE